jgi:hypothetical protein
MTPVHGVGREPCSESPLAGIHLTVHHVLPPALACSARSWWELSDPHAGENHQKENGRDYHTACLAC